MKRLAQLGLLLFGLLLVTEDVFARAGGGVVGGGFGGGGPRGAGGRGAFILWGALLFFSAIGLYAWRRPRKLKETQELLDKLGKVDSTWDEAGLRAFVNEHFMKVQASWSRNDLEMLRGLLENKLFTNWEKKIRKFIKNNQFNTISEIEIFHIDFFDIKNFIDNEKDRFTVEICACCKDEIRNGSGEVSRSNIVTFTEYWTYVFRNGNFVLCDVRQRDGDLMFLLRNYNEAPI